MATTFLTLYEAALRSSQGSAEDDDQVSAAKAAVNEAYLTVCGDGTDWDFLEREGQWVTAPGADVYTYADIITAMGVAGAAIKEVTHLVDDTTGGRPLPSMSWAQLESLARGTDYAQTQGVDGPPQAWARFDERVRLYPTPAGAYTIGTHIVLSPAALSADADTVLIPDAFATRVLVPYAASILLEQDGGPDALQAANRLLSRHDAGLRAMVISHGSAKRPTFNVMSPGAFADLERYDEVTW